MRKASRSASRSALWCGFFLAAANSSRVTLSPRSVVRKTSFLVLPVLAQATRCTRPTRSQGFQCARNTLLCVYIAQADFHLVACLLPRPSQFSDSIVVPEIVPSRAVVQIRATYCCGTSCNLNKIVIHSLLTLGNPTVVNSNLITLPSRGEPMTTSYSNLYEPDLLPVAIRDFDILSDRRQRHLEVVRHAQACSVTLRIICYFP